MKKIIWGIAAVFCVQVGFQLAMTAERSNNDYAALRTPLQSSVDSAPASAIDPDLLDTNIYTAEQVTVAKTRHLRQPASVQFAEARIPRRAAMPATTTTANFKPVVITYDRTGALTEASAFARKAKPPVTKIQPDNDDKRSLIAKIVTKPYDWLKAVGSKLR